ncbi:MAG: dUTP diphosphatase [Candidatus Pacebacteria bacterium]|jgi:dUTP pyrophosphatase|nr:dUTP diphosphatase [Candidatus Paceibacterota bacterium]
MKVKIKRFDKTIALPAYKTAGAAALDLASREEISIAAGQIAYLPLNIALQVPADSFVLMVARSSLHKRGLMLINGVGIGDSDYCGDDDEYRAAVYNFSKETVLLKKGERVVQVIVLKRERVEWEEVDSFSKEKNRGGFGSTGKN